MYIDASLGETAKLVRAALIAGGLEIAAEMDLRDKPARCRLLLVDCPLLVFEGLVLDRAAGVYFPLHVLLESEGRRTIVSVVKPSEVVDARLPAGAAGPIERLEARVRHALEDVGKSAPRP